MILKNLFYPALKAVADFVSKYRPLLFFTASIAWLELVYRLWCFKSLNADYLFPFLFSISAGIVLFLVSSLFKDKVNRILAISLTSLLFLVYAAQLVYYGIFQTPLSFFSITGAGEAMQFTDIIGTAILKNSIAILLLLVPAAFQIFVKAGIKFSKMKPLNLLYAFLAFIVVHAMTLFCVYLTGDGAVSQRTLYFKNSSPALSASKLGLLTTMSLDLSRLLSGPSDEAVNVAEGNKESGAADPGKGIPAFAEAPASTPEPKTPAAGPGNIAKKSSEPASPAPRKEFNTMDLDFTALAASEKDPVLKSMHKYFASVQPTKTNKYTGFFKGCNLILITAEAFSPYAIDKELTPTLYRMANEGFVFKNFYNPVWTVSTSDGEYVACTSLIPKSGVWSFARSGSSYMPFVMGNQFKKLGYPVKAYHDHTYTYYKRNISHPNMGYDYKGVGNGLEIEKTWPESDLEMIEATAGDFISTGPFHNYYMTVSGHMNYNFGGNYMAKKNRARVEGLPLSNASKAYKACNLELEDAMKALLDKLEAAGIADKTVIALSADHYPYGLPRECIDELAGHKVENNFELYKSTFILWKKGMDAVVVDKPCASLDIIPTLSNLFSLEYDSRLLMGRDILSDSPALVIFSNYSWITDRARFDASADRTVFTDGTKSDDAYIRSINNTVANKFKYSEKILDTDYYGKLFNISS